MRRRAFAIAVAVIIFLTTFSLYSMIHANANKIPVVITALRYYWDGEIVLCPPEELREDVQWAVDKWNQAIQYFSVRYMLLDAAKIKIRTSSEGDSKCNVFFELFEQLKGCSSEEYVSRPSMGTVVAYVNFTSPPAPVMNPDVSTPIRAAKIHLWRGLNDLERKAMILHEIALLLGIGAPSYGRQPPYRSASDLWGGLQVTSADVYALFLKNRYGEEGSGRIKAIMPWIIPYTTVEEDQFHTTMALFISIMVAVATYIVLSRRWKVAG